jgi:hypothetical protein
MAIVHSRYVDKISNRVLIRLLKFLLRKNKMFQGGLRVPEPKIDVVVKSILCVHAKPKSSKTTSERHLEILLMLWRTPVILVKFCSFLAQFSEKFLKTVPKSNQIFQNFTSITGVRHSINTHIFE